MFRLKNDSTTGITPGKQALEDMNTVVIYVYDSSDFCKCCGTLLKKNPVTISEVMTEFAWSRKRAEGAFALADSVGMLYGDWKKIEGEWIRFYYLAGEGTIDYIKTLKRD